MLTRKGNYYQQLLGVDVAMKAMAEAEIERIKREHPGATIEMFNHDEIVVMLPPSTEGKESC